MHSDFSTLELILAASIPVQIVMALLLLASFASWVIIFGKRKQLADAKKLADRFEERFWRGGELPTLYREITDGGGTGGGLETIFEAGFREYLKRKSAGSSADRLLVGAQRAMRVNLNREMDKLEHHLSFLATVGSTSPYVGLFGTVWGIMVAFQGLAKVSQATIAMVAPGISEALIATAMGLFAAIPAVIAYNRYANDVERLRVRYETFVEEFASILERQAHGDEA